MTSPKKVSVIFTNYNHEKYLEQAFTSIVHQTHQNLELVVVDDCSTDGSANLLLELIREHENKLPIKSVFLRENKGKWNALNKGIEMASGQLIALQDADDFSLPERLERQVHALEINGSFHNLCGFHHCFSQEEMDKHKSLVHDSKMFDVMSHKDVLEHVHKGFNTPGINHYYTGDFEVHGASAVFFKSLWIRGMKFMPGNMGLRCQKAEDSDHNTKMTLLLQKTSVLREKLYLYRRNTSTNPAWLEEL